VQIQYRIVCLELFEGLAVGVVSQRSGEEVPARTSVISPGGASLMNSAAAESFCAFAMERGVLDSPL